MKFLNLFSSAVMLVLLFSASAGAQHAPISAEHGLKVGDKAPEFKLPSHEGKDVSLEDLRKNGSVALVFHRSADW